MCVNNVLFIAGIAIGITGDAGVRATAQQPRMFVGMVNEIKAKQTRDI